VRHVCWASPSRAPSPEERRLPAWLGLGALARRPRPEACPFW
jgi:hypothetical protein